MSDVLQLPERIDFWRAARREQAFEGRVPLHVLNGVEALNETESLNVSLKCWQDSKGVSRVSGQLLGRIDRECQRCLDTVTCNINQTLDIVLVATERDMQAQDADTECWLVPNGVVRLWDYIAEEILLFLPIVITHENCQQARD